ncbi:MAG TPA: TPM domain-containing protein [Deltaproteobacteria bacterium]|nr:TPM domain-containing protein [Deltaproteobacteria bacterium]
MKTAIMAVICVVFCTAYACTRQDSDDHIVHDGASLLSGAQKKRIGTLCRKLVNDLDMDIAVDILAKSPEDIDALATELFNRRALGRKTQGNKGVLFLIDTQGKQVRLEIGYDLEEIFPDGFVGYIERRQMSPFFQEGKVGEGIEAAVELLVGKAMETIDYDAYTFETKSDSTSRYYSGGAGAKQKVAIGEGMQSPPAAEDAFMFSAQPSPELALEKYKEVLRRHMKDPYLGIYTKETRAFFSNWLVTDAQQDNELKSLEKDVVFSCLEKDNLAVIAFPVEQRSNAPYFLRRDSSGWMLDFALMNRFIGFNHKNQWFFRNTQHEFMFAFENLTFDQYGFPHEAR